jgi:superfamily I DNA/RNA helicase
VFLTADANQSLYNRGFRWRNVHEQLQVVGRTRILRRNYRTTREIAQAAAEILTGSGDADPDALTQAYVHSGVPPQLYGADGAAGQGKWLAGEIVEALRTLRLPLSAAAVLAPSNGLASQMAQQLQAQGLEARFMRSRDLSLDAPGVKVMTLHAAKGLEFPIVAVVHAEADRLPAPIPAAGDEELAVHAEAQRRLFYVGCTRAMRYLFITFDRWLPSPFVTTLSDDRWLRYG